MLRNKMDEVMTVDGSCPSAPGSGLEVGGCVRPNRRAGGRGETEAKRPSQARGQGRGADRSWGCLVRWLLLCLDDPAGEGRPWPHEKERDLPGWLRRCHKRGPSSKGLQG